MNTSPEPTPLENVFAAWLLRLWLGVRAVIAGIEKFAGTRDSEQLAVIDGTPNAYGLTTGASEKVYSFGDYHGVPQGLYDQLLAQPLIPGFALQAYNWILGPALLVLGLTVLLGILPRTSLFLMGLLYTSLTFGLILLNQSGGVAWLGIHIALIALALAFQRNNRCQLFNKW